MKGSAAIAVGLTACAACWLGARYTDAVALEERESWPETEQYMLLPPPSVLPALSLGYRQAAADVLWAATTVYYGSALAGEGEPELRYLEQLIDGVIALDPGFRRVYRWSAYAIHHRGFATQEVIRKQIHYFERGIEAFPDTYEFYWGAGLRYWLDLRSDDPEEERRWRERGAELMEAAMRKPDAPQDLATKAATIRTRLGQHERAIDDLREMIMTTDNPRARRVMLRRLRNLAGERTADMVESAREDFDARRDAAMPYAPAAFYVLVGDPPPEVIDLDALANPDELFLDQSGSDAE